MLFTETVEVRYVFLFMCLIFGIFSFLLLHSPKKKSTKLQIEHPTGYIEVGNVTYKTDNSKITNTEASIFSQQSHDELNASWKAPQIIRLITESYQIMLDTNNPETLCDRYKFSMTQYEELLFYYNQGYFCDDATIETFKQLLSTNNYAKLICKCYQKYKEKAHKELKTKNGIDKRIDRFWIIIQNNVDINLYLELRKCCKN